LRVRPSQRRAATILSFNYFFTSQREFTTGKIFPPRTSFLGVVDQFWGPGSQLLGSRRHLREGSEAGQEWTWSPFELIRFSSDSQSPVTPSWKQKSNQMMPIYWSVWALSLRVAGQLQAQTTGQLLSRHPTKLCPSLLHA